MTREQSITLRFFAVTLVLLVLVVLALWIGLLGTWWAPPVSVAVALVALVIDRVTQPTFNDFKQLVHKQKMEHEMLLEETRRELAETIERRKEAERRLEELKARGRQ